MSAARAETVTKLVYGLSFARYDPDQAFLHPLKVRLAANGIEPAVCRGNRCRRRSRIRLLRCAGGEGLHRHFEALGRASTEFARRRPDQDHVRLISVAAQLQGWLRDAFSRLEPFRIQTLAAQIARRGAVLEGP